MMLRQDNSTNQQHHHHHHTQQQQQQQEQQETERCCSGSSSGNNSTTRCFSSAPSSPSPFSCLSLFFPSSVGHAVLVCCLLFTMFSNGQARVQFLVQPVNKSVAKGSTAVLGCKVANRGGGLVQWSQDGFGLGVDRSMPGFDRYSMIGGEHGSIGEYNLQIQDVQLEDEADYHCQVSPSEGSEGARSEKAHLTVVVFPRRPEITKAPAVPVILHQPTNILCRADGGKPAPQIYWYRNSIRVLNTSVRTTQAGQVVNATGVLVINASMQDQGKTVECRVETQFMQSPFRTTATLDVQFPPNISMTHNITSRNIRELDHVRFQCLYQSNPRQVTWKWYRNNDLIPGVSSKVYHINGITKDYHDVVISCEASNSIGSTRAEHKLFVEYAPRITKITPFVGTDIGQPAELTCEVDGNPSPSVIWRRKDRGGFGRRTLSTKNTYRIDRANDQSFGWYVCTAMVIGFPDTSKEAMVVRNAPPKPRSKKKQETEKGKTGTLTCSVTSIPLPTSIKWFKGGREIVFTLSGRFSFKDVTELYTVNNVMTIKDVESSDFGYYNCTATNAYGTSVEQLELAEKQTLPITYIIVGIIVGFAVIFVIILVCVLYRRHFKKDDIGSVLETADTATTKTGSYTDTDSSSDKKREKTDSPSTLMGQLRQGYGKDTSYRFSADYDDMPYKENSNGNNNGYRFIDPNDTYSDSAIYDGEYIRSDLGHSDRIVPLYSPSPAYNMSSFRGNTSYDHGTPPPTMSRLTPLHMSNSKLATDV